MRPLVDLELKLLGALRRSGAKLVSVHARREVSVWTILNTDGSTMKIPLSVSPVDMLDAELGLPENTGDSTAGVEPWMTPLRYYRPALTVGGGLVGAAVVNQLSRGWLELFDMFRLISGFGMV